MKTDLIFLDIDGTLTDDRKEITPATLAALMQAQMGGTRLVLASARPSPGLLKDADRLSMRNYGGILMAYNGGRIVEAATGRVLAETHMDVKIAKELLHFLKTLPVTVILDDGRQFYVEDLRGYKVEYECRNNNMTAVQVEDLEEFISFPPVKLLLSVSPERISDVQARIAAKLPETLHVIRTADFYLEIIPKTIDKGQGVLDVCGALGVLPEHTAAFGDAENDIPMLRAAGKGFAMGNAREEVKQAAYAVTKSNNEDGIAYALARLL